MTMIKRSGIGLFAPTETGVALVACHRDLPVRLLDNCLIYDSDGQSFPAGDYACMNQCQVWLKKLLLILQADTADKPKSKHIATAPDLIS